MKVVTIVGARPEADDILRKLVLHQEIDTAYQPFGNGHSAEKIVAALEDFIIKKMNG